MSSLNAREDALFEEWKRCLGDEAEEFVPDGAVFGETYESTWPRIVFLMSTMLAAAWDLRDFLRSGDRWQTWNNVTRWTEGILSLPEIRPWKDLERIDKNARICALRKIAAVNIKKTPGGATAKRRELRGFARANREFIRRQLDLYRPHLIVGCGADVSACFSSTCRVAQNKARNVVRSARFGDVFRRTHGCREVLHYGLMSSRAG